MSTQENPKIQAIGAFFAAYERNDAAGMSKVLTSNIQWDIPGHHPLAGTKHGIEETVNFFKQLAKVGFKAEPIFLEANDHYVVDIHRGYSSGGKGKVDTMWALVWHFNEDGKVDKVFNLSGDQHQMDSFIWANYQLKPLPARLV